MGFALAQMVTKDLERAAAERASWKLECRSLAVPVMRLFCVKSLKLGMPTVRTIPITSIVMSNSYSVKPCWYLFVMRAIYA